MLRILADFMEFWFQEHKTGSYFEWSLLIHLCAGSTMLVKSTCWKSGGLCKEMSW